MTPQICGGAEGKFQSSVPYTVIFFWSFFTECWGKSDRFFRRVLMPVVFRVSSGSVREGFGDSRSLPEHFPYTSRRKHVCNKCKPDRQSRTALWSEKGVTVKKLSSRIRYRTLKFRFCATAYLWGQPNQREKQKTPQGNDRARKSGRLLLKG